MNAALSFGNPFAALRRYASANALRVVAICIVFGVLAVVAVYYAREPAVVQGTVSMAGLGGSAGTGVAASGFAIGVAADDPVARFWQSRVGHILYSPTHGDHCRRVLFNNRTGALYEIGSVLCVHSAPEAALVSGADRMQSLRKSFQK